MTLSDSWAVFALIVSLIFGSGGARAEDLTTTAGRVFRNVEIRELDCDSITVIHSGGTSKIPLKDLPLEIQKRYSPNELLQALRRTAAELEKLKDELAAARGQTPRSTPAVERLARDSSSGNQPVTLNPPNPTPPVVDLPAPRADDTVTVEEMIRHYKTNPLAADLRYKRKVFRVQGKVERFEEKPFVRRTAVLLESSERSLQVKCEVPFPEEFNAVFSTKEGRTLVGARKSRSQVRLMDVGETVSFKGRCAGLHSFTIVFSQCERIR